MWSKICSRSVHGVPKKRVVTPVYDTEDIT